nr:reverse transcriptase, RNA-dependent DNA polymerase, Gag-polypeptide of LTR copia-type [Tanacetum cinerariifolium]
MVSTGSKNTDITTNPSQGDINSPHHPLYFHPNDHRGLLLIAKKLNGSDNYGTWKRLMLIALSAKNKIKLIIGEYDEPKVYYHKLTGPLDEIDAIEAPYACTCKCVCDNGKENGEREQRRRLIQFLMGLDECYTNIRGQILLMQHLPLVAKAYNMLIHEEKQRDFPKHSSQTPVTLNTYRNAYTLSYRNNNHPNTPNNPTNGLQTERRNTFRKGIFCGYYKKEGHPKEECYKLLGYPRGHPCTTSTNHHLKGLNKPIWVKGM